MERSVICDVLYTSKKEKEMRNKEEVAIAWLILAILLIPLVILYPAILMVFIIGYCSYILYDHYSGVGP